MCLKMKMDSELLPNIENCDPFNYPVLGTSAYTSNLFKAYKCSEAFETFPKNVIETGRILDDLDCGCAERSVLSVHYNSMGDAGECVLMLVLTSYIEAYMMIKGMFYNSANK